MTILVKCNTKSSLGTEKPLSPQPFCLGQIGELANQVSNETQADNSDIPWKSMIGLRNRIVHNYDNVNHTILWATISDDLPELRKRIEQILKQLID